MDGAPAVDISGSPTAEEVAAIMAAYEALWPRPVVEEAPAATPAWRFSGRWWQAGASRSRW